MTEEERRALHEEAAAARDADDFEPVFIGNIYNDEMPSLDMTDGTTWPEKEKHCP